MFLSQTLKIKNGVKVVSTFTEDGSLEPRTIRPFIGNASRQGRPGFPIHQGWQHVLCTCCCAKYRVYLLAFGTFVFLNYVPEVSPTLADMRVTTRTCLLLRDA